MKTVGRVGIVVVGWGLVSLLSLAGCSGENEHVKKGREAFEAGQFPQAIREYTAAIESRELSETDLAQACYYRGRARYMMGELRKAIADYTTAIELDPENAEAYYHRGITYRSNREKAKGDADLRKAKEMGYTPKSDEPDPADPAVTPRPQQ